VLFRSDGKVYLGSFASASDGVKNLNEQLNSMMKSYLMKMHKKNYEYEQRKYEMIIKNMVDNIKVKEEELKEY
jgi:hypothetical protein